MQSPSTIVSLAVGVSLTGLVIFFSLTLLYHPHSLSRWKRRSCFGGRGALVHTFVAIGAVVADVDRARRRRQKQSPEHWLQCAADSAHAQHGTPKFLRRFSFVALFCLFLFFCGGLFVDPQFLECALFGRVMWWVGRVSGHDKWSGRSFVVYHQAKGILSPHVYLCVCGLRSVSMLCYHGGKNLASPPISVYHNRKVCSLLFLVCGFVRLSSFVFSMFFGA